MNLSDYKIRWALRLSNNKVAVNNSRKNNKNLFWNMIIPCDTNNELWKKKINFRHVQLLRFTVQLNFLTNSIKSISSISCGKNVIKTVVSIFFPQNERFKSWLRSILDSSIEVGAKIGSPFLRGQTLRKILFFFYKNTVLILYGLCCLIICTL